MSSALLVGNHDLLFRPLPLTLTAVYGSNFGFLLCRAAPGQTLNLELYSDLANQDTFTIREDICIITR